MNILCPIHIPVSAAAPPALALMCLRVSHSGDAPEHLCVCVERGKVGQRKAGRQENPSNSWFRLDNSRAQAFVTPVLRAGDEGQQLCR